MLTSTSPSAPRAADVSEQDLLQSELRRQVQLSLGERAGPLGTAATHALASTGKLVRPRLVLDACRAVGGDPDAALPAAVGTELGHIASLVHDDIIDGDVTRRGQPAVHAHYVVPLAILTGDLLVFQTFLCYTQALDHGVSPERTLSAIRILSQTCIELCRGQALEAAVAGDFGLAEADYLEVVRLKTASVCRGAAEIGATLGGGSPAAVSALGAYGEAMGIAFQIIDDLLEYVGDPLKLGKPVDSDIRNVRVTLPLIYALEAAQDGQAELLRSLLRGQAHAELAALLQQQGALARTRLLAERYTELAQQHLEQLPSTPARERLRHYATDLLKREH